MAQAVCEAHHHHRQPGKLDMYVLDILMGSKLRRTTALRWTNCRDNHDMFMSDSVETRRVV